MQPVVSFVLHKSREWGKSAVVSSREARVHKLQSPGPLRSRSTSSSHTLHTEFGPNGAQPERDAPLNCHNWDTESFVLLAYYPPETPINLVDLIQAAGKGLE